jgi:ribonuclease T2
VNRLFVAVALSTSIFTIPAHAQTQGPSCTIPDRLPEPRRESPPPGEIVNIRPTQNLLSLSWSPQFCKRNGDKAEHRLQCGGEAGKFGFILHGLWPDVAGKRDPAYCRPAKTLPKNLIRQHFCMTPSPDLLQHEWAKHGTCATDDPERYFKAASLLYSALTFPDMDYLSRRRITVSSLTAAFASRNPGLRQDAISVKMDGQGWLQEVRVCLDANMRPKVCNPEDRGARGNRFIKIWRGGR